MDAIDRIDIYPLAIPRDTPYLGPLEKGVVPNERGYFVRPGNRSIYSIHDQVILVKLTTRSGAVGWGETYSVLSPEATAIIIRDAGAALVVGRDPHDGVEIYEDLYNAMRVRGYYGGFYGDALAALDIALWDLRGRLLGLPICKLLGGQRRTQLPAYVSGIPGATRAERVEVAQGWLARGFSALKFAAAVAADGEVAEMRALREAVGDEPRILIDFHWRYSAQEAIQLITRLEEYDLHVAEAPVQSEDVAGQAQVARSVKTPVALGEELRTVYEFQPRFAQRCMDIVQPEMGRTGITSFWQICQMAKAHHLRVMPHASIGIGLFQAASLHAAAALDNFVMHEYQHSIFDKNLQYIRGNLHCENGYFTLPDGPGLGVEPDESVFVHEITVNL